jgi:hypothetical protein
MAGRPAGSRVSFRYVPRPEEVVLDLAIQAAGLVSVPVSPFPPPRSLTPAPSPDPFLPPSAGEGKEGKEDGGVVVVREGESIELAAADLIGMAERVQAEIQSLDGREIVVLGGPLEDPAERAMLSWATVAGAAVVLEPNPSYRIATAAWVRPTVFHGTPEEIAGLRAWVEKERKGFWRRGPRLPFRRLRTVLVTGVAALAKEDAAFWQERGVRVARVRIS